MANAFRSAESDRPGAAFVSLPKDVMEGPATCEAIPVTSDPSYGPGTEPSLDEAANCSSEPQSVLSRSLGMLASRDRKMQMPSGAFLRKTHLPIVGTFQAAGNRVRADLFERFCRQSRLSSRIRQETSF